MQRSFGPGVVSKGSEPRELEAMPKVRELEVMPKGQEPLELEELDRGS